MGTDRAVVHLNPAVRTRAEFSQRADELAHDLMVLLRRRTKAVKGQDGTGPTIDCYRRR